MPPASKNCPLSGKNGSGAVHGQNDAIDPLQTIGFRLRRRAAAAKAIVDSPNGQNQAVKGDSGKDRGGNSRGAAQAVGLASQ